ncbi:MAG: FtsX-like permease family protein [Luteitalea sp.]|nr:FtsX-like permease family protein [Luteitalea sp.]
MRSVLWQAWQSWKGAKTVAVLAAIAFGVGIGSATAIYTVVNAVMLRPLPYAHADRLVALYAANFTEPETYQSLNVPDLVEYQQRTQSFDVFGWFRPDRFNLTSAGQPQHVNGAAVTPALARSLGVNPSLGQWFDDETGAVISNALWQRLGADPNILGQAITLNDRRYTVTGVMAPWFRLPLPGPGVLDVPYDVWLFLDPQGRGDDGSLALYFCYARLKPGVRFAQAEADVKRVAAEIAKLDPSTHASYTARLEGLRASVILEIRPTLLLLFGATGLLLLITCANVAGLLLARSVARARETAIRVAIGASQWLLARQYFIEGLFVSLAGAAAGVFLSIALVRAVVSLAAEYIPRADEIAVDWRVLLFAIGTAFLASALASLAPLWQAMRTPPNEVLTEGVRTSAGARSRRLSRSLVIAEIALAFTLLAVSAVLILHLRNLTRVRPGFDPDQLLTFQLTLGDTLASSDDKRLPHQIRLLEALEAIPGVSDAAFSIDTIVGGGCMGTTIYPDGRRVDSAERQAICMDFISPGYFATMRIPLRSGRLLTYQDTREDLNVLVINQAAARRYWPNKDPLGAYGRLSSPDGDRFQVVGVVGDVKNHDLGDRPAPQFYMLSVIPWNPVLAFVRSPLPPERLVPEVRRAIQRIDPTQPIHSVATMNEIIQGSLARERAGSFMMAFFAFAALLMAMLGIYGVVAYSVRQRTVEIGTRMALGAIARDIFVLVLGGGLKMAAYGVVVGAIGITAAVWILVRFFEVHDLGWLPFVSSTAIVVGVAIVASFVPAWRATLLSPMVAIRDEPGSVWQSARQRILRGQ